MNPITETVQQVRAFNRFYTSILGLLDKSFLNSEYSVTEVRILYEIHHSSRPTARRIMEIIQVDEGYLSRTIGKLVRLGLVEKTRDKADQRNFLLVLTEKGTQELDSLDMASQDSIQGLISHLDESRQQELLKHMDSIHRLLNKTT